MSRPTVAASEIAAMRTGACSTFLRTAPQRCGCYALFSGEGPSGGVGDGRRCEAEVLEELLPGAAGAIAVVHTDVLDRDGFRVGEGGGNEAAEAAEHEVVFGRRDGASL